MLYHHHLDSPVGPLLLVAENDTLIRLEFTGKPHAQGVPKESVSGSGFLDQVCRQLGEYFDGRRRSFDCAVQLRGSAFQKQVWHSLQEIPWGQTQHYQYIAEQLGKPTASRAIGTANGQNPISIVFPCHRIIGKNGHLTGYAGGLEAKQWLLRHEGVRV